MPANFRSREATAFEDHRLEPRPTASASPIRPVNPVNELLPWTVGLKNLAPEQKATR